MMSRTQRHDTSITETAEVPTRTPRRRRRGGIVTFLSLGLAGALVAGPVTTIAAPDQSDPTVTASEQATVPEAETNVFGQQLAEADASPSHLSQYERIINVWETDGSNYNFTLHYYVTTYPNALTFKTMTPGSSFLGYGKSFTLGTGMCAVVSYNDGAWQRRGPGTHYFSDGAKVEVDPHRC